MKVGVIPPGKPSRPVEVVAEARGEFRMESGEERLGQ